MSTVFICYRRNDSRDYASRLYKRLVTDFGRQKIFMDICSIRLGTNWVDSIEQSIRTAGILIAIVGKGWTTISDEKGNRRLCDPNDPVRRELAIALKEEKTILPILFEHTTSIAPGDLPADIEGLSKLQYLFASDANFEDSYKQIKARILDILSWNFLRPISLEEAFSYLLQMKSSIKANPLSDREISESLRSFDPASRINAYLELQIRPQEKWLRNILNCIHLEHFEAANRGETRPLWQLFEVLHLLYENENNKNASKFRTLSREQLVHVKFCIQQSLDFLVNNTDTIDPHGNYRRIDPSGECKRSAKALIAGKIDPELCS